MDMEGQIKWEAEKAEKRRLWEEDFARRKQQEGLQRARDELAREKKHRLDSWMSNGGDPADFASVTFRSTSTGIADLDANAPEIKVSRANATKLRRPRGAYTVRANFYARDNVDGNAVTYRVAVTSAGVELARKTGKTTSGRVSVALRIRPPARSRTVRLEIDLSDPLGNQRRFTRSLRLRG